MRGGRGSPIPKSICQNSCQKVNILMKTKNAPKGLKCKINHTFFLETGVPKRGEGGGPTFGKSSQKIPFLFFGGVPSFNKTFSSTLPIFQAGVFDLPAKHLAIVLLRLQPASVLAVN